MNAGGSGYKPRSLVARTTLSILAVIGLVGTLYLALGYALMESRERQHTNAHLNQLLDTVARPASIACFLNDPQLAGEVADGLMANELVARVAIDSAEKPLAQAQRTATATGEESPAPTEVLIREISSPFDAGTQVGTIRLTPDRVAIERRVRQASTFIGALMLLQILAVAVTVAIVVYGTVTRPLKQIASRLATLPAEQGARLIQPRTHEKNEIGAVVSYINRLLGRLVGILEDERHLRMELEIEERRFRSIFENAETGIFVIDQSGNMLSYNPACWRMLQRAEPSELSPTPNIARFLDADEERVQFLIASCRRERRSVHRDVRLPDPLGRQGDRWIHLTLTPIGEQVFQGVVNDITERKVGEVKAIKAAMTDPLTGLLNRMGFVNQLNEQFKSGQQALESWVAMLLVDLDLFKQVNDTYGHDAGDRVLIGVAELLRGVVRKTDLVGRLGGDEFVILINDVSQPEAIEKIAQEIVERTARPFYLGEGCTAHIGASVGVSLGQFKSVTREQLFKQADEAMYQAKHGGRNAFCFYGKARISVRAHRADYPEPQKG